LAVPAEATSHHDQLRAIRWIVALNDHRQRSEGITLSRRRVDVVPPVALTTQYEAPGLDEATSVAGHNGVPTAADPVSEDDAARILTPSSSKVHMFSVSSYSVASAACAARAPPSGARAIAVNAHSTTTARLVIIVSC